ncbi:MAG: hypothetical protein E6G97_18505 [Alphaproteobacteria bacterium]|nr:MAG: hypothetical protein E6G97_18505 [Alphaproteobacteria bacterium]
MSDRKARPEGDARELGLSRQEIDDECNEISDKLSSSARREVIERHALAAYGDRPHLRGTKQEHARAVAKAATRLAAQVFGSDESLTLGERRMNCLHAEMAGLLHEALLFTGLTGDVEMLAVTDDPLLNRLICRLTPAVADPEPIRLDRLRNRVGFSQVAQVVKLADLCHDMGLALRLIREPRTGCFERLRLLSREVEVFLKLEATSTPQGFRDLWRCSEVREIVGSLRRSNKKLTGYLDDLDAREKKREVRRVLAEALDTDEELTNY